MSPALALLALLPLAAPDGWPGGRWEGTVGEGTAVAVTIAREAPAGGWAATIDLPAAGVLGVPVRELVVDGDRLAFELPTARGPIAFRAQRSGDALVGAARTEAASLALRLVLEASGPPPYATEPIAFGSGDVRLAGSLLVPDGRPPFPAVVLLHGSGPEQRHQALFLADRFARCGVAALVYDKRGTGGSSGSWERARFADLTADATAALARLRRDRRVDADRIGIVGPSQGAWIAPLAALRDRRVAAVVLVSGGGVTPGRHLLGEAPASGAAALDAEAERVLGRWWRTHRGYDPLPVLTLVDAPLLAVLGSADRVTPVAASAARLGRVTAGRDDASRVVVVPGADHTLHVWDAAGWARLAPGAMATIVGWTRARLGAGPAAPVGDGEACLSEAGGRG